MRDYKYNNRHQNTTRQGHYARHATTPAAEEGLGGPHNRVRASVCAVGVLGTVARESSSRVRSIAEPTGDGAERGGVLLAIPVQ